jgi:hypothetical protein
MLDTVQKIINCKLCRAIVKKPVFLPCGETICARHEKRFRNIYTAKCYLCNKSHRLKKNQHFPYNKVTKCLLKTEINKLDFGDEYKKAKGLIQEVRKLKSNYENTKNATGEHVFERFQEMRRKVDLIRESIIQKVNECSEKIIADIDSYETECKTNLATLDSKLKTNETIDLKQIKKDLNVWKKRMKKLYYDSELCKEINQKGNEYSETLQNGIKNLKNEIFLGQDKKLEFETKYSNVFDIFCKEIKFNT